jgi:hypothetical protein
MGLFGEQTDVVGLPLRGRPAEVPVPPVRFVRLTLVNVHGIGTTMRDGGQVASFGLFGEQTDVRRWL